MTAGPSWLTWVAISLILVGNGGYRFLIWWDRTYAASAERNTQRERQAELDEAEVRVRS